MKRTIRALMLLWLGAPAVSADTTRIAVAANFTAPMRQIVSRFEQASEHRILLSFGSSGKLFAQIQNGAPFDAFLSADADKPAGLIDTDLAVSNSRFTYAIGALALWGANTDDPLALLRSGNYRRLAIANPRLAPYGTAALQTLANLGVLQSGREKLVRGENISQVYQFVASGNADIGFVAMAQLMVEGQLPAGAWRVPNELHDPIRQQAVLLRRGENNPATLALLNFLRGNDAAGIIRRHGYYLAETESPGDAT